VSDRPNDHRRYIGVSAATYKRLQGVRARTGASLQSLMERLIVESLYIEEHCRCHR
jgi:hypothetical protein